MSQAPHTFHLSDFENLQEDLLLLRAGLEQGRADPARARLQCQDILSAVATLSAEQLLGEYGEFVGRLVGRIQGDEDSHAKLGHEFWVLTLDVFEELLAALEMVDAGLKVDPDAMNRHIADFDDRLADLPVADEPEPSAPDSAATDGAAPDSAAPDGTSPDGAAPDSASPDGADDESDADANGAVAAPESANAAADAPASEPPVVDAAPAETAPPVSTPPDADEHSPQDLLTQAAAAAAEGRHEDAQRLATAAATGLGQQAGAKKVRELSELRDKLLVVDSEVEQTESSLAALEQKHGRWQEQADTARADFEQAAAVVQQASDTLQDVKGKLEEVERRMAKLQDAQQKLMASFEEALPAKEAAEQAGREAEERRATAQTGLTETEERRATCDASVADLRKQRDNLQDRIAALEQELES